MRHFFIILAIACFPTLSFAQEGLNVASVYCYMNGEGYLIGVPDGWVADSKKGSQYGICAFFYKKGENFDNASAIIYPKMASKPKSSDPVDYYVKQFIEQAKSKKLIVKKGDKIEGNDGMIFQTRYFDNGPTPNNFELVTYQIGDNATLIYVLSAMTEKDRADNEKVFIDNIKSIFKLSLKVE